jgi:hypothetical protein
LTPIGIPKNLEGTTSERHERKDELASKSLASTLRPNNFLFTKLILRPDTISNPLSNDLIVQRFAQLPSPIKIVRILN